MSKIKILIVEDEFIIAEDIKESLEQSGYHVIGIENSFSGAIQFLADNQPDIAIIDIYIKGDKTGIDLGHYIRANFDFPFIYLSSHGDKNTVMEATSTKPNAYLIKPFKSAELYSSIEVAISNCKNEAGAASLKSDPENVVLKDAVFIKKNGYFIKVMLSDIVYVHSEGNYLELVVNDENKYLIRSTLKEFIDCLPGKSFIRIHNSYVININCITLVSHTYVKVNTYEIPISRNRKEEVMKLMNIFS